MTDDAMQHVTDDFIFGTLATDEQRLASQRATRRGLWHGSRIDPQCPGAGEPVRLTITVGTDLDVDEVKVLFSRDDAYPSDASETVLAECTGTEWDLLTWSFVETWTATIDPGDASIVRYRVRGRTPAGEIVWADTNLQTGRPGIFAVSFGDLSPAAWLRDAVIYHVFVDRFARSGGEGWSRQPTLNDFWGGTLRGVIERLDHIATLGANAIWLSPIFPSPSHHGYDATDYVAIEPRLGTMEDFDALVAEAHRRGIRVILDFVANHVSNEHPAFVEALAQSDSDKRDWFSIDDDGGYASFFGVQSMPEVAVDTDAAAQWLIDSATFWLRRGVDGFRLDYAVGPSLSFWTRFRHHLRQVTPHVALLGEIVEGADSMKRFAGRLDGALDFLFLQQIRAFAGVDVQSAADFWRAVSRSQAFFSGSLVNPTFLDNHDMNRFLWITGGDTDRLKIAALIQLTMPQPPIIYYGTEVGLNQWHDLEYPDGSRKMEESRTPMLWGRDQNAELLEFYRSMVFWRMKFRPHHDTPQVVHAGEDQLLYRVGNSLVAVNRSGEDIDIDLGMQGSTWLGLATSNGVQLHGRLLTLPAYCGAIVMNER